MAMAKKHQHKSTYYNDVALRLATKLFGIEHLHYGFFKKGLAATIDNIPKAQAAYAKELLSNIPKGVHRILDVGCGTGGNAKELVKKKHSLVCIAPDPYLIEKTLENTSGKVETRTDLYENINDLPEQSFDLVLMSESCQYVKIDEGWKKHSQFLKPKGYVIIADFFRIKPLDRPGLSKSGHPLDEFLTSAKENGFKLLKKRDITPFVAPTMDIYQGIIKDKVFPIAEGVFEIIQRKFPILFALGKKLVSEKVEKLRVKYSNQDSKTFREYKQYLIMVFQKT